MSFLDKLKRRVDVLEEGKLTEQKDDKPKQELSTSSSFTQLDVDIYETPDKYLIFAAIPGVDITKLDISVGDENDVLIIKGRKESPADSFKEKEKKLAVHHQECQWGDFYRQIILPEEINPELIDAYEDRGILIVSLPILRLQRGKKNIQVGLKAEN